MDLELLQTLAIPADTKIVLLVMDGLGGLPGPAGLTELEAAATPHLDKLARSSICGLHAPVGAGIAPGSGPAHLALFGYDPLRYQVGRGVLSALGVDFPLAPGDVAARGNFCTVDPTGRVVDRRAGRIPTETSAALCAKLRAIRVPDVEIFVEPEIGYRFLFVLRGADLGDEVSDTDPQREGVPPNAPAGVKPAGERTAAAVAAFVDQARDVLAAAHPANMVLLRGFSQRPEWPLFPEVFGVRALAIAAYPMYRGVARLVGMTAMEAPDSVPASFAAVRERWSEFDFFYVHVKRIDSAGEDGDFAKKAALIAEVDAALPALLELAPDVLVVTGDHSTPALIRRHGWHPVPVLLHAATCRPDTVAAFGETACLAGGLGPNFPAQDLMPLAMAHGLRVGKYGA